MAEEELQEIDLMKPGKLWATAEHNQTLAFHLLLPKDNYTRDKLTKEPNIAAGDQLMSPAMMPAEAGPVTLDFAGGKAQEILDNLTGRYKSGAKRIEKVRAVIIATAADGNKIPDKQVAEVMDFKLAAVPIIMLRKQRAYATVQEWKAGQKLFSATIEVKGPVDEVEISIAPTLDITAGDQKGSGKVTLKVKEGEKYTIQVPVTFTSTTETRQVLVVRTYIQYIPNGWRTAGGRKEYDPRNDTREVYNGGSYTLTVTGTKDNANVKHSIELRAESWGADWLIGPPPPPFWHNCC